MKIIYLYLQMAVACTSLLCLLPTGLLARDCLSESYSLQLGRKVLEPLISREISASEYEALGTLLESLKGDWEGSMQELICKGEPGDDRNEVVSYSVKSRGKLNSSGKFEFRSTVASREKKSNRQDKIILYLTEKNLATALFSSGSNIEIAWASASKLIFVRKTREKQRTGNRKFIAHEWMTVIEMLDDSTVSIEKTYYRHGKMLSHSSWRLEAD